MADRAVLRMRSPHHELRRSTLPTRNDANEHVLRERRIAGLLAWLPGRWPKRIEWLREPSRWWARLPIGLLLILGGLLWFLPVLGLWMLPLGLLILSEDIGPLRKGSDAVLAWIERRHPKWLKGDEKGRRIERRPPID